MLSFTRSKEKEDRKEEALSLERERIKNKVFELEFKLEKQTTQIRELARYRILCDWIFLIHTSLLNINYNVLRTCNVS